MTAPRPYVVAVNFTIEESSPADAADAVGRALHRLILEATEKMEYVRRVSEYSIVGAAVDWRPPYEVATPGGLRLGTGLPSKGAALEHARKFVADRPRGSLQENGIIEIRDGWGGVLISRTVAEWRRG